MRVWAKKAMAAVAGLILLTAPAAAQVPDPFARELAQKLARADAVVAADGYARAAGPFAGGLRQGEARRFTVTLRAGQPYRIVGVCDEHCSQVHLAAYDPSARRMGADRPDRDAPELDLRAEVTGLHTIEATMVGCEAATCWYAFNVYSR